MRSYALRGLCAFDGIEEFHGEVIAAGGEFADAVGEQVVGHYGWNGRGQTGGCRDQRF